MTQTDPPPELALAHRTGLPDALRVLLEEYPRQGWAADPGYKGLVSLWLDRHMMFRQLLAKMTQNAQACLDGQMDPRAHAGQLERLGSMFVGELHVHHNVEDVHYFPIMSQKEARVAAGFALLDSDHHALDGHLNRFVERANGVLKPPADPKPVVGRFLDEVQGLGAMLDRHLTDEEELVVPVILKYGAQDLG